MPSTTCRVGRYKGTNPVLLRAARAAGAIRREGEAAKPMQQMMSFAMEHGLYLSLFSNVIRLTPPLNIAEEDLRIGIQILDHTLEIADRQCI